MAVTVLLVTSSPAVAAQVDALSCAGTGGGLCTVFDSKTSLFGGISTSASRATFRQSGDATAFADFGELRLFALAFGDPGAAIAGGRAQWSDVVTFTGPGLSGPGKMLAIFEVSGSISGVLGAFRPGCTSNPLGCPPGSASSVLGFSIDYGINHHAFEISRVHSTISGGSEVGELGDIMLELDIFYGVGQAVLVQGNVTAAVDTGGAVLSAIASVDLTSTLAWKGVVAMFDSAGNPVTDFTATSASGFDYGRRVELPDDGGPGVPPPGGSVPQPAAVVLLAAALTALVPRAFTTRRRSAP